MDLVPLSEWAKCLACDHSFRLPLVTAPACCDHPFVISLHTPATKRPA